MPDLYCNGPTSRFSAVKPFIVVSACGFKVKVKVKNSLEQATKAQRESRYVGHLESKERLRIQPAQLFNFS